MTFTLIKPLRALKTEEMDFACEHVKCGRVCVLNECVHMCACVCMYVYTHTSVREGEGKTERIKASERYREFFSPRTVAAAWQGQLHRLNEPQTISVDEKKNKINLDYYDKKKYIKKMDKKGYTYGLICV